MTVTQGSSTHIYDCNSFTTVTQGSSWPLGRTGTGPRTGDRSSWGAQPWPSPVASSMARLLSCTCTVHPIRAGSCAGAAQQPDCACAAVPVQLTLQPGRTAQAQPRCSSFWGQGKLCLCILPRPWELFSHGAGPWSSQG